MATIRHFPFKDIGPELLKLMAYAFSVSDVRRNCTNCRHFDMSLPTLETCNKYKRRPPATVIVDGCDSHDDVYDIPF
jgi:hypothetical protein